MKEVLIPDAKKIPIRVQTITAMEVQKTAQETPTRTRSEDGR
jgi:hypothetical protein